MDIKEAQKMASIARVMVKLNIISVDSLCDFVDCLTVEVYESNERVIYESYEREKSLENRE